MRIASPLAPQVVGGTELLNPYALDVERRLDPDVHHPTAAFHVAVVMKFDSAHIEIHLCVKLMCSLKSES
jgi:hypothetical protein